MPRPRFAPRCRAGVVPLALAAACAVAACATRPAPAPEATPSPAARRAAAFAAKVAGLERRAGMIDLYLDAEQGRVFAAFPAAAPGGRIGEYLYVEGITTGLGSNPVGLDRGQIGETHLVAVSRVGGKVLVEALNTRFRAGSDDPAERAAVAESFATSVLWAGSVVAEDAAGRTLVDLEGFLLRDAHRVAAQLARSGQGSYALDRERSAIELDACLAFPQNVELESRQTFTGASPGPEVRATAPAPQEVTLTLHQSLLALPPEGYRPRAYDPRMGSYAIRFADYSQPLAAEVERRWVQRFRLEKADPAAEISPVRQPLVYYVDRGAPEPVRGALVEGASWWAAAFEAAGFRDAFRVELLPEGAHPLDARYNVIQWVHRATRGWSFGGTVTDPRTGEIVKGHVSLGSLRVRQDRLLFEGLLGAERTGSGAADDPVQLALARIRQLAAHEVGHTLGLSHNFAASTRNRASVMDYPAPLVRVAADGSLDVSHAYARGVGAWDVAAIRWAYSQFPTPEAETEGLARIVEETLAAGLVYLGDDDARPAGAALPVASLWDNGADVLAELGEVYRVRERALEKFGTRNVRPGTPLAHLEEVLAPVYLYHRYQLAAAVKAVGGLEFRHALAGDGQRGVRLIAAERQRRALGLVLEAIAPRFLDLPDEILRVLPPRPPEHERSREQFAQRTGPAFDALGAAATAADLALGGLFQPERAARLVDQHRRDPDLPGLDEVLDAAAAKAFADTVLLAPREVEIARVVQRVLVDRWIELAEEGASPPWVRARVNLALGDLLQTFDRMVPLDEGERAHVAALAADVGRHLARLGTPLDTRPGAAPPPPGEPIGGAGLDDAGAEDLAECGFEPPPGSF